MGFPYSKFLKSFHRRGVAHKKKRMREQVCILMASSNIENSIIISTTLFFCSCYCSRREWTFKKSTAAFTQYFTSSITRYLWSVLLKQHYRFMKLCNTLPIWWSDWSGIERRQGSEQRPEPPTTLLRHCWAELVSEKWKTDRVIILDQASSDHVKSQCLRQKLKKRCLF